MTMTTRTQHAAIVGMTAVLCLAVASRTVFTQRGGGGGAAGGAKPLVPLTAASILLNPAAHIGENASMMAAVEAMISKTVFTVDQDKTKSTGQEVLVIAPALTAPPALNSYVTVQGEVIKFDPEEVARKARGYTLDMPADAVEKFRGKPAVIATAVITTALLDLAKKPVPPMTPDDVLLDGYMKAINPAFTALRAGLDKPDAALVTAQVATIKKGFSDVQTFFKVKDMADALQWSGDALKVATAMEQSASAGKWDEIKASATTLQQSCTACHTARRERVDDGTYRLKIGPG
jgi:cytochrome c556